MASKNGSAISRREFARRAAFVSAAASLSPAELLPATSPDAGASPLAQTPAAPRLSPESQTELDARIQAIFAEHGSRLSDAQKADLRHLAADGQASLDRLRAFTTSNADAPALYLKPLVEREKKPGSKSSAKPSAAPKKP